MKESHNQIQESFSDWIKKLEKESWQMELLISGFSLAIIFNLGDAIGNFQEYLSLHYNVSWLISYALVFLWFAVKILSINLMIHLVFRAFWIGMIGLRSVSSEIDFEKLHYSKYFTNKLKSKSRNLDEQIIALDNICSSIFAFTFLVVFWFISFTFHFAFVIAILLVVKWIGNALPHSFLIESFSGVIFYVTLSTTFLYFIDFITLGLIKKIKFLSRIYYPFYHFYSIITFSFFYRSIYYHFISRFSKKKIALIIFPYLLFAYAYHAYALEYYIFIPDNKSNYSILNNQYDNLREKDIYIDKASIESDIISSTYLKLFIRYNVKDNVTLSKLCPDYLPHIKEGINKTGNSRFHVNGNLIIGRKKSSNDPKESIKCLSSIYKIYLNDSLLINPEFFFYENQNNEEIGLLTYLETENLEKGKNIIFIKKLRFIENENDNQSNENSLNQIPEYKVEETDFTQIPFWLVK